MLFIIKRFIMRMFRPIVDCAEVPEKQTLCVIGNGPSLEKDILIINKFASDWDFAVVNQFSTFNEYIFLRPKHYFLVDSAYWDKSLDSSLINYTMSAIESILILTKWNMSLYVPSNKKEYFSDLFKGNENIKVCGLVTGGKIFKNESLMLYLLKKRLMFLPTINIIHFPIQVGFYLKYENIFVFGIDSDVFKSFYTDQVSNLVYKDLKYYQKIQIAGFSTIKKHKSLSQRLGQASLSFKLYEILAKQAEFENVKLKNCSSYSIVDSLDRKRDF